METANKKNTEKKSNYLSLLWFFLGFGLFMFTRSTLFVPISIVLAPVFILHFIRSQKPGRGIMFTLLGFCLSITIALWGLFDLGDNFFTLIFNIIRSVLLAIALALPYIADRLMYKKAKGFLTTLVFPVSATALYFLNSLEGPFDGDGVFSLYFIGDLSLKQLVSVTGLWGLVFTLSWISSVISWGWENEFQWEKIKKGVAILSSAITLVFVCGGVKLGPFMVPDNLATVRIAAVVLNSPEKKIPNMENILKNKTSSPFDLTMLRIKNLTKQAASGGARIVSFQEYAIFEEEKNKDKLVEAFQEIAKEHNIYLSISYGLFAEEGKGENRHIFINDQGEIEANYLKRYLLGLDPIGGEAVYMKKGPEIIPVVNTPYGNIGISICRDMSFPPYIRQAGKQHVDIMLSPAFDFPRGKGHRYLMRAIENGFSFVRPTYNGVTFAVDYHGRILASKDYFATSNEIMYADVPMKGKKTIYPVIGDVFAWLCVLVLGSFVVLSIKGSPEKISFFCRV
jgi:apolipoprotein N-acyltransferase